MSTIPDPAVTDWVPLGGVIGGVTLAGTFRRTGANIAAGAATPVAVGFDTEDSDPLGLHDPGTPTRFTIVTAGVYGFVVTVAWVALIGGQRAIWLRKNGAGVLDGTASGGSPQTVGLALQFFSVGSYQALDYVEVMAQSSIATNVTATEPAVGIPTKVQVLKYS